MSTTKPDAYNEARDHAEAGRYEQALEQVRKHLVNEPNDTEALNDAGAILYAMGRFEEAIDHLRAAISTGESPPAETLLNLAEVHLAAGQPDQTLKMLGELAQQECLTPDLAVRVSTALLNEGRTPQAVEALVILKHLYPDTENEVAESALAVIRSHRPKVSFFFLPSEEYVAGQIRDFLADRFEVRWSSEQEAQRLQELLDWSDIAWFESCDSVFAVASRNPGYAKLVCRLKMYKDSNPWIDEIQWQNVDVLILPSQTILDKISQRIGGISEKTRVVIVPNGVDLDALDETPKPAGTNIACIGLQNIRMRPELLELVQAAAEEHPELKLFLAAEHAEDRLSLGEQQHYAEHIDDEVISQVGMPAEPIEWLLDKQYILATNYFAERTPLIAECLAVGLQPLIYVPEGEAPGQLAEWFGFTSADELQQRVFDQPHDPQHCRKMVEEHFSYRSQMARLNDVLLELEQDWLCLQPEDPQV